MALLLMVTFIGWVCAGPVPLCAQEQAAADAAKTMAVPEPGSRCVAVEDPGAGIQVVEKAEAAKPRLKKKPFPWLGVILGLAVAGGLIYYFLILKTTLRVDSDPSGAKVYLDGKDTAQITPCELKPAIGAHKIKLSLNGYADVERDVVVKNGKNSLTIPLEIGLYTLLTPANNANVLREAPCLISWDSNALAEPAASPPSPRPMAVTNVDLELYQGDVKVADIARGVPNSGSYTWNVPGPTAEGHDFKIQISCGGIAESRSFGPAFNLQGFREDFADNKADFWLPDSASAWNAAAGVYSASITGEGIGVSSYDFFYAESSFTVESR
ncbi:MAG TPA: PEGA domain-containing protein, partial [Candidatus Binatia bacterium]|nr:PEGA domain-containing protein [Candidatus Binatia bacterium]